VGLDPGQGAPTAMHHISDDCMREATASAMTALVRPTSATTTLVIRPHPR
jgi:hypothetical protein